MKFLKGRHNLAVTTYVPYDCPNNCRFCTSKQEYSKETNLEKVKDQLYKVRHSSIEEVVFTGGEPMMNVDILSELSVIVNNKDIYVNTSLITHDIDEFIDWVNCAMCIKGVNISRHSTSFESESLQNIANDEVISQFKKPVKINVVIDKNTSTPSNIREVLKRWSYYDAKVSFRADFNKMSQAKLHSLRDPILSELLSYGEFVDRKYCDVCDTTLMKKENQYYEYHRGLATTSIKLGNSVIVNDIIIFPDGELCYDWDRKSDYIDEMKEQFQLQQSRILEQSCGNGCGGSNWDGSSKGRYGWDGCITHGCGSGGYGGC